MLHILFCFRRTSVYSARDSGADGDCDPSNTTLLDLQRGPPSLKQVKKGDRVLCYHSAPERSLYSIAEVTRDPYPDPHDYDGKNLVADLRAYEKLPRPVTLAEMRANSALRKVKLLKSVRRIISPITEAEYQEILRMAGIVAMPGMPLS
jgi:predicted RNA-binding protein with PUA-like domain